MTDVDLNQNMGVKNGQQMRWTEQKGKPVPNLQCCSAKEEEEEDNLVHIFA